VPLRQRFTLGTLRLELIPTGRMLGAAALHVDLGGRSVLYAGRSAAMQTCAVRRGRGLCTVRRAAPLLRAARRRGRGAVADARPDRCARSPVPRSTPRSTASRLAARLVTDDIAVAGSRAIRDAALRIGDPRASRRSARRAASPWR
jgi:hypothetical protein